MAENVVRSVPKNAELALARMWCMDLPVLTQTTIFIKTSRYEFTDVPSRFTRGIVVKG